MDSFEIFVKAMPPSLSELKVLPSFCFAFKIPGDRAASNTALCHFLSEWRHGKILPRSYGSVYIVLDSVPSKVELRPRPIAHHGLLKCKNLLLLPGSDAYGKVKIATTKDFCLLLRSVFVR